jgi:hypothetical protein
VAGAVAGRSETGSPKRNPNMYLPLPLNDSYYQRFPEEKKEEEASINTIIHQAKTHRSIKKNPRKKYTFNLTRFILHKINKK